MKTLASLAAVIGAATGLTAMFIVGSHQRSILLMAMFTVWVLSPFVALLLLNARAGNWSPASRATVQYATILISLAGLARYAWVVVWPLKAQPASTFLIVPFLSWVALTAVAVFAWRASRQG